MISAPLAPLTCFLSRTFASTPAEAPTPRSIDLTDGWRYWTSDADDPGKLDSDSSEWLPIFMPHNACSIGDKLRTDKMAGWGRGVWFDHSFAIEDLPSGWRVILQVLNASAPQAWINEKKIEEPSVCGDRDGDWPVRPYGASSRALTADITEYVKTSENALAVKAQIPGIQGAVRLHIVPPVHVGVYGLRVDTLGWEGGPARVRVATSVENHSATPRGVQLAVKVVGPDGKCLAQTRSDVVSIDPDGVESFRIRTTEIPDPPLWSVDDPQLCRAVAELLVDGVATQTVEAEFGFRWFRFDADEGFFLNGESLPLRGTVYTIRSNRGFATPRELWDYELGLAKGMGLNHLRHTDSVADAFLKECDRAGILLIVGVPHRGDPESIDLDVSLDILQKYNHPSIIGRSTNGEGKNARHAAVQSKAGAVVRRCDPSRVFFCNELGWRSPGTVGLIDCDVAGQGNYTGWYEGTLDHIGPYMDRYRELLIERYGRPLPIIISNYGAASDPSVHTDTPRRNDYSVEYHTAFHKRFESEIVKRPFVAGGEIFCYRDLDSNQPIPRHTWKGVLDREDNRKDAYFQYQSLWTEAPMVHIAEQTWTPRQTWPPDAEKRIEAFSNCDSVELFLNQDSLGRRSKSEGFVWKVIPAEGASRFKAVGAKDGCTVEDRAEIEFQHVPPAPEPRLVATHGESGNIVWQVQWDPIDQIEQYAVYAGAVSDFPAGQPNLLSTASGSALDVDPLDDGPYFRVAAKTGGRIGAASDTVGLAPGALRWRFANSGWIRATPVLIDLTGDGKREIVFGSYNGCVYAMDGLGKILWEFDTGTEVFGSPAAACLEPGELPSIVVPSSEGLFVLANDGRLKWKRDGVRQFDRSTKSPAIGDIDGDGRMEIVVGSDTGELLALDADGDVRWKFATAGADNRGINLAGPMLVDAPDGPGKWIVFAADNGMAYVVDGAGQLIWDYDLQLNGSQPGVVPNSLTMAAGPLEDGGPVRILFGVGAEGLKCFDVKGRLLWNRPGVGGQLQISNLYGDGARQIVIQFGRHIRVLDSEGCEVWTYTHPDPRDWFTEVAVAANLDGAGELDLVCGTRGCDLYALNCHGQLLWTYSTEDELGGSTVVADIDGDGFVEVVFGSRDGRLYVLNGGRAAPGAVEATQYKAGPERRSYFGK